CSTDLERIAAVPNTKAYGSLSIAVQYYTKAKLVTDVPKTAFMPQPNVVSSVLKLERREKPLVDVPDDDQFFELVQTSFRHRRKNIKNNFMAKYRQSHGKDFVNRLLEDRKSTRLNSSHVSISYAVFCLKTKTRSPRPSFVLSTGSSFSTATVAVVAGGA